MSDLINYLFMNDPGFRLDNPNGSGSLVLGALSWFVVLLVAGIVLLRMARPKNLLRQAFRKRTAVTLVVLGVLGLINMIARMLNLDVLEWRFWTYLVFVASLGFALYSFFYSRNVLPARISAAGRTPSAKPRHMTAPGTAPTAPAAAADEPKSAPITGRRDARRAKKRKR